MRHEFSDEYHESVRLMIGSIITLFIVGSILLCTCGPCMIYALRRSWTSGKRDALEENRKPKPVYFRSLAEVLEENDRLREAGVHCKPKAQEPKPEPPQNPKEPVKSWLEVTLLAILFVFIWLFGFMLMDGDVDGGDLPTRIFCEVRGGVLAACLAVISVGLYLRCVPAVILQLRRKPNGVRYQPIVEAIVKEDQRRKGAPRDTYFDNNGFDEKSQMAIFALAGLISIIPGAFVVVVPVVLDYFGGNYCLKALIKSYVKYYYNPEQMHDINISIVDELMLYSKEPVNRKGDVLAFTKAEPVKPKEQGWKDDFELSAYNGPVETPESIKVEAQGKSDQAMDVDSVKVYKSHPIIHADNCNCFKCSLSKAITDDDPVPPCDF